MLLAHRIECYPTAEQADYLDRACGSRRHCFNQLLAHFKWDSVKWSKKAAVAVYKNLREEFDWYSEVSQRVTRNAIEDLDSAFKHFFRRVNHGEDTLKPTTKRTSELQKTACGSSVDGVNEILTDNEDYRRL